MSARLDYADRRALQEAILAPCQLAIDAGHMENVLAALVHAFGSVVLASGMNVEAAIQLHNQQLREVVRCVRAATSN